MALYTLWKPGKLECAATQPTRHVINVGSPSPTSGHHYSAKHSSAIACATSRAMSRRFFKHTISSLAQHTSARTCAIFFKTYISVAPVVRRASHAGSHVALDVTSVVALVCGQHAIVASHVACLIALALVCFVVEAQLVLTYRVGWVLYCKHEMRQKRWHGRRASRMHFMLPVSSI